MPARLPALHVGQGTYAGGLSMFPVWLAEAARGTVELGGDTDTVVVAEREGSPVVGELVVHNRGRHPVALLEGDLLEGGWQDRSLVRDVLLAAGERRVVEVCCVEQGRWSGTSTHGHGVRRIAPSVMAASRLGRGNRQQQVWHRVERYSTAVGPSVTGALRDHLDTVRGASSLAAFRPLDGQRGVVVGVMGVPVALELFDSHRSLLSRWATVIEAGALDARLGPPVRTTGVAARRFAERVQRTMLHRVPEGPGRRVRSDRPGISVRGLQHDGDLVHLSALSTTHPLLVGV